MNRAAVLNTYLIEIFKNHKLMKIFQKKHMKKRADDFINKHKETSRKINIVHVRASPIMVFNRNNDSLFNFCLCKISYENELEVSNFFFF